MKYMLQIFTHDVADAFERLSEDEQKAIFGEYMAIMQVPGVSDGAQLQPTTTATTVRVQDGRTLTTDGPFPETKEALGGYYLLEAADLDAAIELAARIPAARLGGAVEVRPLVERDEPPRAGLPGGVGARPRCARSASSATSTSPRKPPRRRLRRRRSAGRATACRERPGAWLTTTARNRAIDRIRRDRTLAAKSKLLERPEARCRSPTSGRPCFPTNVWS